MLEFFFGYLLGSATAEGGRLSGRTVAKIFVVLFTFAGRGYFAIDAFRAKPTGEAETACVGLPLEVMMCNFEERASDFGLLMLGVATLIGLGIYFLGSRKE